MISSGVNRLVAVLPKQIEVAVWFYFLKVDFVGIGLVVRSQIEAVVCYEFGRENSRVWAREFCYGLA